ncbi:MAG TPA: hypothetical protein DCQ31_11015 [Bacteroidales bacterium]|nr:hypothetical protein [Bacteroidales bacterium]
MRYPIFFSLISIPVYLLLYVFTAIIVVFIMLFSIFSIRKLVRFASFFWGKFIFVLMLKKLKINGLENIDKNKKYILVANHASLFDIPAIMSFYPNVAWFGREYLLKIPLFGNALKQIGYIPMKTANVKNTKVMLQQLVQQSDSGTIAMFPEGTRTKNNQLQRFHRGFIQLMKTSELDILPVTLNGFFELKPKIRTAINFSAKLELTIHEPFSYNVLVEKSDEEIIGLVKSKIESALRQ